MRLSALKIQFVAIISIFLLIPILVFADDSHYDAQPWQTWVAQLRIQALEEGIEPQVFDEAFDGLEPGQQQLKLAKNQPEKRLSFLEYRASRIDKYRILIGRREYQANLDLLNEIGKTYQVDPRFVAAIWGIESSYGFFPGTFPVIKSLATLAYQSDRPEFFRKELILALKILNDHHITLDRFKGEWAGASGQPQFLPSSWYKYAVDYDQDGHKDIWTSKADALASIANYLHMNGWNEDEPWGAEVSLKADLSPDLLGLDEIHSLAFWEKHGVILPPILADLNPKTNASLLYPNGGPYLLVLNNFRVILQYNNSSYYAASVAYLAEKIGEDNER